MKAKLIKTLTAAAMVAMMPVSCIEEDYIEEVPLFYKLDSETITAELADEPACVLDYWRDCVIICYSEYADEYFDKYYESNKTIPFKILLYDNVQEIERIQTIEWDTSDPIQYDLRKHLIGVSSKDFRSYNIPIHSKVYVTASVTNNDYQYIRPNETGIAPLVLWRVGGAYHAYLKNIKVRN